MENQETVLEKSLKTDLSVVTLDCECEVLVLHSPGRWP